MLGFAFQPKILLAAQKMAELNIGKAIPDPQLRKAVTPDWQIGCKRILISNDYYPALDQDHVDLVTDGIREITPTGIPRTRPASRSSRSMLRSIPAVAR